VLEAARAQRAPVTLSSDLEALPMQELRRIARQVIGPGGDRDPTTGRHLRRVELLAALQRMLDKDRPVSSMESSFSS